MSTIPDRPIDPILAAMEEASPPSSPSRASPQTSLGKRARSPNSDGLDSSEENELDGGDLAEDAATISGSSSGVSQNTADYIIRYAQRKKLDGEQLTAVEAFMKETLTEQLAKVFVGQIVIYNKIDSVLQSAPAFQLPPDLKKDIHNYSICVLLSSKIPAFKGDVPRDHVIKSIKKFCLNLPPNIEQNTAGWARVKSQVSHELRDIRTRWKKILKESVAKQGKENHMDIYTLSTRMIGKSSCNVTVPLACRVAMMRAHVATSTDGTLWDAIDRRLQSLRDVAEGDERKMQRAFTAYLDIDRKTHGNDLGRSLDENPDELQDIIDETIASSTDAKG